MIVRVAENETLGRRRALGRSASVSRSDVLNEVQRGRWDGRQSPVWRGLPREGTTRWTLVKPATGPWACLLVPEDAYRTRLSP